MNDGFQTDHDGYYIEKLPGSKLDYGFLWERWLKGGLIANSNWDVPEPLTEVLKTHDGTTTAIVISGGESGNTYTVTNTITTADGLIDSRSFRIICRA